MFVCQVVIVKMSLVSYSFILSLEMIHHYQAWDCKPIPIHSFFLVVKYSKAMHRSMWRHKIRHILSFSDLWIPWTSFSINKPMGQGSKMKWITNKQTIHWNLSMQKLASWNGHIDGMWWRWKMLPARSMEKSWKIFVTRKSLHDKENNSFFHSSFFQAKAWLHDLR